MAEKDDILHYVDNNAFKNLNKILRTFEDPVKGAFSFNDSKYVSWKSDSDHTANNEPETNHFSVSVPMSHALSQKTQWNPVYRRKLILYSQY